MTRTIRIGSRRSKLALVQSEGVKELIETRSQLKCEIITIDTMGDRVLDWSLPAIGDKGLFTKELEQRLIAGDVDIAVHSLKDLPTELPSGLTLAAVPTREDPRDVFLSMTGYDLQSVPPGGKVATGSLRRRAQLARMRPDVVVDDLRGNVPTRIEKLRSKGYDGIILAAAGLKRLHMLKWITAYFEPEVLVPAAGQGALGVESREDERELSGILQLLNDERTFIEVTLERKLLGRLGGGCQIPVGIHARLEGGSLYMVAVVADRDGRRFVKESVQGLARDRDNLLEQLYAKLESGGALSIVEALKRDSV